VGPSEFRRLLGRFATGVAIITATDQDGSPAGMTANSLTAVSLDPPLVSVCVDRAADMHAVMERAPAWVANVLEAGQESLSRRSALKHPDRFEGVGFRQDEGLILLDGALAHITCEPFARHEAGDHTIYVGRVVGGATHPGEPLLYFRGGYAGLGRG
jgi:flavin reductase (DIM6/NTAB) family NADH-FMN oxidoreductase RutF